MKFSDGIRRAKYQSDRIIFLEVGPGRSLTGLVQKHFSETENTHTGSATVISSLPHRRDSNADDHAVWLSTIGKLWELGYSPDFRMRKSPHITKMSNIISNAKAKVFSW